MNRIHAEENRDYIWVLEYCFIPTPVNRVKTFFGIWECDSSRHSRPCIYKYPVTFIYDPISKPQ